MASPVPEMDAATATLIQAGVQSHSRQLDKKVEEAKASIRKEFDAKLEQMNTTLKASIKKDVDGKLDRLNTTLKAADTVLSEHIDECVEM